MRSTVIGEWEHLHNILFPTVPTDTTWEITETALTLAENSFKKLNEKKLHPLLCLFS